jgi:hypothetical protein
MKRKMSHSIQMMISVHKWSFYMQFRSDLKLLTNFAMLVELNTNRKLNSPCN